MDTIGQFFTKRNPTNPTPIKKAESDESDAYKKEIDWTPIEVDWKAIDDTWKYIKVEWKVTQ